MTHSNDDTIDSRITVLIADEHAPIRTLIRLTLESEPRFYICGEVADGLSAAAGINATSPRVAIVMLSAEVDKHFIDEAKKAGARGYVVKTRAEDALIRAIDAALVYDADFVLVQ